MSMPSVLTGDVQDGAFVCGDGENADGTLVVTGSRTSLFLTTGIVSIGVVGGHLAGRPGLLRGVPAGSG